MALSAYTPVLATYGPPEIFNSDQGSQFTSTDFTDFLKDAKSRYPVSVRSSRSDGCSCGVIMSVFDNGHCEAGFGYEEG